MKIHNKSLLLLTFFFLGVIIPLQLSQVSAVTTIDDSTIDASATTVSPGNTVEITVYAINDTLVLANTDVFFQATNGNFQGSGSSILTVTNSTGFAVVTWTAPFVDFTNDTVVANITAQIQNGAQTKDLFQLITIKHLNTDFIENSVFTDPSPIQSDDFKEITFTVKDKDDNPVEGMQVTATELTALGVIEGEVDSDIQGLSDENGLFQFNWTAPTLALEDIEINIQFSFLVEASATVNLLFNEEFFVTKFDATVLTVTLSAATEMEAGTNTLIDVSIFAGLDQAEDANITLTVDQGEFSNSDTQILLTANATGLTEVVFTAPTVLTNTTITIAGDAILLSLIGSDSIDILVYVVEREFEATMTFSETQVKQNESLTVTITVTDKESTDVVVGATVSFLLELGVWDENNNALYSTTTNAQGIATATFDGTDTAMIFQIQKINVTTTITTDNYAQLEVNGNFSLEKLPDIYTLTATMSASEVTEGGTVTITVDAKINGVAYANTTVHFFAQAGTFDDGTSDYRLRTDAQGNLIVTWDSSSLPDLQESRPIFIEVDLVNSGLDKILLS
ncbi:MAG: hypothetical protein GPJ54_10205, partial [Candidatus Heimdallarchaeota archaeon]|nr:hypothetical protein [Candidatus Heimdallarchaeota archaeon]